jgi:acyl carrier protein
MKEKLLALITEASEEVNEELTALIEEKGFEAPLFVRGGLIDSLGLVNLVVALEGLIEDEYDVSLTLADERALSQEVSPFESVERLVDYVMMLMEEENA